MVITSATSPSIFQPGLFAISGVQPVDLLINTSATTSVSNVDIVDISALGQLLSASSIFESGILQSTATGPSGFTTLATATQLFVDAFNRFLQSDSGNLQNPPGLSLGNLFAQVLLSQSSGNGTSIIASLSSVGINFVPPLTPNDAGQLTIDFQSLQSAFNTNPIGTTSLLAQAIQSIGQQAAAFSSTAVQLENLTQIDTSLLAITAATSSELATATAGTTAPLVTTSTVQTTTGLLSTTETPTTMASIATQTATGLATTTTPLAVTTTPVTTVLPTATAQLPTTGLPTTTAIATQPAAELPATTTPSIATTPVAATVTTVTTEPTVTEELPSTGPTTATVPTATQTATELPTTATPQIVTPVATTTTATTALPAATTQLPAAGLPATAIATPAVTEVPITTTPVTTPAVSALPTTPLAATPTTPNVTPNTLINRVVDASDPAIAAAIMAYHLVDGIIDTGARHYTRPPPAFTQHDEVLRVDSIRPAKLDLYA